MSNENHIEFLRGSESAAVSGEHPILELSDEELQRVIAGAIFRDASSTDTGSYGSSGACCDGTKVCCNNQVE